MIDGKYNLLGYYDIENFNLTWLEKEKWVGESTFILFFPIPTCSFKVPVISHIWTHLSRILSTFFTEKRKSGKVLIFYCALNKLLDCIPCLGICRKLNKVERV
jgi:hypothetical protein